MKVTLIPRSPGWMLMQVEVDTVCMKEIGISGAFPPFAEMYTWLGRIRDRQLPAEMIIDEEGYGVILRAELVKENNIDFSIRGWLRNEDTTYLKTEIEPDILIKLFHDEIVSCIEKQAKELEPCFIVQDESLNWNSLLKQPRKPQDWAKRLAIYGGAKGKGMCPETYLENFSLTEQEKYLIELKKGLGKISRLALSRNTKELSKLIDLYKELAIDLALDVVDSDWYEQQKEKLNTKYQIDKYLRGKTHQEKIEERKRKLQRKQPRLSTLKIGQIVDGTIFGLKHYVAFVDIGGTPALLDIADISQSHVQHPQQVFKLNDWVRAKIVNLDRETGRVALSTKELEQEPGQMLNEPWTVYQNATTNNQ